LAHRDAVRRGIHSITDAGIADEGDDVPAVPCSDGF
jgi:hypothetical protein